MKRNARGRGMAIIWVAITLAMLTALVGLACDLAHVRYASQKLQIAADASALAAARLADDDDTATARSAAISIAAANHVGADGVLLTDNPSNTVNGDIVFGWYDSDTRAFLTTNDEDPSAPYNAVKVVARRTTTSPGGALPLVFGPAFGVSSVNLERQAVAQIGEGYGAGLIAISPNAGCSLLLQGAVTMDITNERTGRGAAMHVNSSNTRAFCIRGGTADSNTNAVNVVGGASTGTNTHFDDMLHTGQEVFADPLADVQAPTWNPTNDHGAVSTTSGSVELEPGYYSGGISGTGGNITLRPGVYVLDGAGLNLANNVDLSGQGVMLYIKGTGTLTLNTTGAVAFSGIQDTDSPYWGVSVFQDNTLTSRIVGNANMALEDTLYFRRNHVSLSGAGNAYGNQIIANTIEVSGTGRMNINYDGRFAQLGGRSFLVK